MEITTRLPLDYTVVYNAVQLASSLNPESLAAFQVITSIIIIVIIVA